VLCDQVLTSRVITYWENFSVHAFENTTQNFFQATTLQIGPKQTACSCCFTIRRDVSRRIHLKLAYS
jgi:hypothetical protein